MTETKFDVSEGIKREIGRLGEIIREIRAHKISVRDSAGADVTDQYDETISECARELDRLKRALDSLHVA
jgi:phage host-nuclease inhibitor protein Gam